jgi:hypothetical protein
MSHLQPDNPNPHGECADEIYRLESRNAELAAQVMELRAKLAAPVDFWALSDACAGQHNFWTRGARGEGNGKCLQCGKELVIP